MSKGKEERQTKKRTHNYGEHTDGRGGHQDGGHLCCAGRAAGSGVTLLHTGDTHYPASSRSWN